MEIDIKIPWSSDKNLGAAYNRLMQDVRGWVCFMDHDVLQLNPNWYHMCLGAIKKVGTNAGWITGMTNLIACRRQYKLDAPKNHNILKHIRYARKEYERYGDMLCAMPEKIPLAFSGCMILTHRWAWEKVGGFPDGFTRVDNEYYRRLEHHGYERYVMPGLYMYHVYNGKHEWNKRGWFR